MKNITIRSLILPFFILLTLIFSSQAFAQPPAHNVCFYSQPYYQGQSYCATPGIDTPDASQIMLNGYIHNWDKRIQSIQLIGAAKVTVWNGKYFTGTWLNLTESQPNLGSVNTTQGLFNWMYQISSYKTHW